MATKKEADVKPPAEAEPVMADENVEDLRPATDNKHAGDNKQNFPPESGEFHREVRPPAIAPNDFEPNPPEAKVVEPPEQKAAAEKKAATVPGVVVYQTTEPEVAASFGGVRYRFRRDEAVTVPAELGLDLVKNRGFKMSSPLSGDAPPSPKNPL